MFLVIFSYPEVSAYLEGGGREGVWSRAPLCRRSLCSPSSLVVHYGPLSTPTKGVVPTSPLIMGWV